ncbi:hypothetical protein [Prosthecobacter sp.]|uniref:hypothetical protein n=1 Tax=Prosthecobacter sp. TaxID=1965333 RepID=UPI0024872083|nr:hypothetical protein [Prosthecobacter sp.]MDI1311729.1 hypothetical protein [Prosthecobacter sp.]
MELKVVPETPDYVEWVTEGDVAVTNRFGNPSILMVGSDGGAISLSVTVHDAPQANKPAPKSPEAGNKWRRLAAELPALEIMADKRGDFDACCATLFKGLYPINERSAIEAEDMAFFIQLLKETDRMALVLPSSMWWSKIRGTVAEAAGQRLAVCLDSTADKSKLQGEFWTLLRACVTNVESLKTQLQNAIAEFESIIDPQEKNQNGRNAAATALDNHLSTLPFLLYVQIRNALPDAPVGELKNALREHGFSKDEIVLLMGAAK